MAIFHVHDPAGKLVGVVRQGDNDESAIREALAGKGKNRDERYISQNGGYVVSVVEEGGPDKVLWQDETARQAGATLEQADEAQDPNVAGAKPDNRGSK